MSAISTGARRGESITVSRALERHGVQMALIIAGCLAISAVTLLFPATPTYDPWAWILWGREIVHLDLVTEGGPSWKPFPIFFTVPFSLFGQDLAPYLWLWVARALHVDFSVSGALYLVALTNFVAALPAAPGSIGTFDAAVAFGAKALGATGSAAVSYVLLLRFVLYVPITVFGLVMLVTRYGGWSRLRSAARLEASRA